MQQYQYFISNYILLFPFEMKSMLSVKAKNVLSQYIRAEVHLIVVTSSYSETTASAKGTVSYRKTEV